MAKKAPDKPKIIIDDDWKTQAQSEKENLSHQADQAADQVEAGEQPAGEQPGGEQPGEERQLPPASFSTMVGSLVTQIMMALAGHEDPKTKKRFVDLDWAKHQIDVLVVLQEKTAGNLTDDEKKLLDRAIYESRMQYVQIAQLASGMGG